MNKPGCVEDIHPSADSLPVMTNSHQDQSFLWSTSQEGHVLTDDILNSPRYEIEV